MKKGVYVVYVIAVISLTFLIGRHDSDSRYWSSGSGRSGWSSGGGHK